MVIRKLGKEEHSKTRGLYETVFYGDEKRFVDYYYQYRAKENTIYGAEDEAGLHAMVHLNPCRISWNGTQRDISYLVAVATEERYRHQGLMRRLLVLALEDEYRKKAPFAFLMPASEAIYTPFGFRTAWKWQWEEEAVNRGKSLQDMDRREALALQAAEMGRRETLALQAAEIERREPLALQPAKIAWPVRIPAAQLSGDQLTELSRQVNRSLARRFTMFVHRDAAYYRRLAKEQEASGGRLEILLEDGVPVCARCSAREEFPPMMVRILDLEAFLAGVQTGKARTCIWRIRDGLLPGNDGLFEVTLTRQGGRLRRLERLPGEARRMEKREWEAGSRDAGCPEPGQIRELDISQVPEALGEDNPFLHAMICEVV